MLWRSFLLAASLCGLLPLVCPPALAQKLTAREIEDKFKYSVFTVRTDTGSGTGFKIYDSGFLTCFHDRRGGEESVYRGPR